MYFFKDILMIATSKKQFRSVQSGIIMLRILTSSLRYGAGFASANGLHC